MTERASGPCRASLRPFAAGPRPFRATRWRVPDSRWGLALCRSALRSAGKQGPTSPPTPAKSRRSPPRSRRCTSSCAPQAPATVRKVSSTAAAVPAISLHSASVPRPGAAKSAPTSLASRAWRPEASKRSGSSATTFACTAPPSASCAPQRARCETRSATSARPRPSPAASARNRSRRRPSPTAPQGRSRPSRSRTRSKGACERRTRRSSAYGRRTAPRIRGSGAPWYRSPATRCGTWRSPGRSTSGPCRDCPSTRARGCKALSGRNSRCWRAS